VQQENPTRAPFLRLVNTHQNTSAIKPSNDDLGLAADRIEALNGKNIYTDFIKKHGRRPDRDQAAAIGRLMGGRVRASDGSLQPILTEGERAAIRAIRTRRRQRAQLIDHLQRTATAVAALAQNRHEPSTVIDYGHDIFSTGAFLQQLESALAWFNRFAEEFLAVKKPTKPLAPYVKNALAKLTGIGLTTEQIVARLKKDNPKAIEDDKDDLIDIALTKLVNQVGLLQSGSVTEAQLEMFHEYSFQKRLHVVVETPTGPIKIWKSSATVSTEEAARYISDRLRPSVRRLSSRAKELQRFLDECNASSALPGTKLLELWLAAKKKK
jgi:hypothetical protein